MTTESDMFLTPRPKLTSLLQVGFNPSPQLNDALHRFLLPEAQQRDVALRAEHSRVLSYMNSDNNGVLYHPEDARHLAEDVRKFNELGGLAIAINRLEVAQSNVGDVQVRLGLDLTPRLRRSLGGFVLGSVSELIESPPWVHVELSRRHLREQSDIISAARHLNRGIIGRERRAGGVGVHSSSLYVSAPHIIERTGQARV